MRPNIAYWFIIANIDWNPWLKWFQVFEKQSMMCFLLWISLFVHLHIYSWQHINEPKVLHACSISSTLIWTINNNIWCTIKEWLLKIQINTKKFKFVRKIIFELILNAKAKRNISDHASLAILDRVELNWVKICKLNKWSRWCSLFEIFCSVNLAF